MEQAEKLKILKDLIAINSANGNELAVAKYLHDLLAQHGIESKVDAFGDKRANLTFELGQGEPILGITGHMDTVALGDLSKWKHDPLTATLDDGKLYGRGAADMKSGLAAQIIAMIELHDAGQIPGHLRFIGTAGEEYGTPGADRLEAQGIAQDLSALLVGEPSSGNVVFAHSGCYYYRIVSHGRSVHASAPERGLNALDSLIDYCLAERSLFADAPVDEDLGVVKHAVTIMKGGEQINTIPDTAELRGNIRPTNAFNNEQVTAKIKAAVAKINAQGKAQLTFSIIHDWWPVASDKHSKFVQQTLKAVQAAYADYPDHSQPQLATMNGATDASVFVKHHQDLPVIVLGADKWAVAHQINEYTTIPSYLATITAYKNAIRAFLLKN